MLCYRQMCDRPRNYRSDFTARKATVKQREMLQRGVAKSFATTRQPRERRDFAERLARVHLRLARAALPERDRHLGDPRAGGIQPPQDLFEIRIACGVN